MINPIQAPLSTNKLTFGGRRKDTLAQILRLQKGDSVVLNRAGYSKFARGTLQSISMGDSIVNRDKGITRNISVLFNLTNGEGQNFMMWSLFNQTGIRIGGDSLFVTRKTKKALRKRK